jgi:hypothetical protein
MYDFWMLMIYIISFEAQFKIVLFFHIYELLAFAPFSFYLCGLALRMTSESQPTTSAVESHPNPTYTNAARAALLEAITTNSDGTGILAVDFKNAADVSLKSVAVVEGFYAAQIHEKSQGGYGRPKPPSAFCLQCISP